MTEALKPSTVLDRGGGTPKGRLLSFLDAWRIAPPTADVEIRHGHTSTGEGAVGVSFCERTHGFTSREARLLADVCENAMRAFPNSPDAHTLPNLILGLRAAADKADAALATPTPDLARESGQ